MEDFKLHHWGLLDVQYTYLDDGYTIVATTDVPAHLFKRETTIPPRKHAKPSWVRGIALQGDIRFCFDVYTDFEQNEPGDTLTHTFTQTDWPVGQRRWFYFVGKIGGLETPSETAIFDFVFPGPPPDIPPPIEKHFIASQNNRTLWYSHGSWATAHNTASGNIHPWWELPNAKVFAGDSLTASYFFWREVMDFPPLSLPATAKIVSAQIVIYVTAIFANDPVRPNLYITQGTQQLPPVLTDYGAQLPFTAILGQVDIFDLTLNAYNEIPLNAAGIALIDPLAITRFCLRGQNDVNSYISVPRYTNWIQFYSQQKGVGYHPLLKIRYYPA